ncbi:MAG: sigma-70 family RNA polymerase sigma factor [Maricaulaceae bacterium]
MSNIQTEILSGPKLAAVTTTAASVTVMPGRADKDSELMARIVASSDRRALEEIAVHYGPRLKSFLTFRGESEQTAEDIIQDVIILVWTKATQFDAQKGSFSAWVYRMTRNKWIDHKRKHNRLQPTAPDIMATLSDDYVEAADIGFDRAESSQAVRKRMALLPNEQKKILHMSFFEGLSHNQIAERTGLPLGTVKGRIRASLKKMRPGLNDFRGIDQ